MQRYRSSRIRRISRLLLCVWLAGSLCAQAGHDTEQPPRTLPYDQVNADIPLDGTPIASVALARLTIALHHAKSRTEARLCHGNWSPSGDIVHQDGPQRETGPTVETGTHWHYTELRQPLSLNCNHISRAQFFLEMSRHLPAWVSVRPAGQFTAFRQGATEPRNQTALVNQTR